MKGIKMLETLDRAGHGERLIGAVAIGRGPNGEPILLGCKCTACEREMVPPVPVCPVCGGEDMREAVQPGEGELYSYTIVHVGPKRFRRPLALGYVDLDNGVRVFAHLEGETFAIGERMKLDLAVIGRDPDETDLTGYVFRKENGQ